ncbi:MAG: dihydrofolate reductase [Alphaproteobacteria bacterium]|nr:dihydrofolate reductase [Alphaproteobacteria bacterium]
MKDISVCSIVAVGPYDVIGQGVSMPWHSKQDFYHFKKITTPYPCIFGRNTYENMPKTPLPNRLNIVCSSKYTTSFKNGTFYVPSIEEAINFAKYNTPGDKIFICGGSMVYKYALEHDLIDVMYLTKIHDSELKRNIAENRADFTYFPIDTLEFFESPKWQTEEIKYPNGVLPVETGNSVPRFFKSVRIR